jgi:hypothetical protein
MRGVKGFAVLVKEREESAKKIARIENDRSGSDPSSSVI